MTVTDITSNSVNVKYELPDKGAPVKTIKVFITNRDSANTTTILVPAKKSDTIPLDNLKSGTDYLVFLKSISEDGEESDYSSSEPFTTGK